LRFVGVARYFGHPGGVAQVVVNTFPTGSGQGRSRVGLFGQQNGLAAEVDGQLYVGEPVADDVRPGQVVGVGRVEVVTQQAQARLAAGQVVVRKAPVDVFGDKANALTSQNSKHEPMSGPERVLRKTSRAQAVLVADQHQLVFGQFAGNAGQGADGAWQKLKLIGREAIDLLAGLGLHEDGAVTVDEKGLFQIGLVFWY